MNKSNYVHNLHIMDYGAYEVNSNQAHASFAPIKMHFFFLSLELEMWSFAVTQFIMRVFFCGALLVIILVTNTDRSGEKKYCKYSKSISKTAERARNQQTNGQKKKIEINALR